MTKLSDEKIEELWRNINQGKGMFLGFNTFARAIEAAVLEAQGKQGPVAWAHDMYFDEVMSEKDRQAHIKVGSTTPKHYPIPLYAAPVVQHDMVMVPREATMDMGWAYLDAARAASPEDDHCFSHPGYRAMIAAAVEGSNALANSAGACASPATERSES